VRREKLRELSPLDEPGTPEEFRARQLRARDLLRGDLEGPELERHVEESLLATTLRRALSWGRANSVFPVTFGLACCAIEMIAASMAKFDIARFGSEVFRPSPRQADIMIVAGRVSQKMAPVLRQVYDQMMEPKWVISMGVCASSGGMFNNYAIVQGVDHVVPVDMYLPGCPPRPEMLIDAILKLREKIMHEPLGPQGRKMLEARKERGDVPVVPYGSMPSSYRSDKARRAEWTQAVREGREEQLRIENWMKNERHLQGGGRWS